MSNPFEDADGQFLVLVNEEGQHSLWPARIRVPDGWDIVHAADSRSGCVDYVEANWTDMRPHNLIRSGRA